jgi:hypothetical protein
MGWLGSFPVAFEFMNARLIGPGRELRNSPLKGMLLAVIENRIVHLSACPIISYI